MIKLSKLSILVFTMAIALAMPTGKAQAEGASATLDILFLKSDSANYDYAITGYGAAGSDFFSGDIERVEPGFDSGFRLSYNTGKDFVVRVTSISINDSNSSAGSGNLAATQSHPNIIQASGTGFYPEALDSASADASLDYTVLDLEIGTPITLGSNAAGKLFAGLRIMDVSNELDVSYSNIGASTTSANVSRSIEFNGFGVRTGFETRWNLGKVNLVAGAAFSLLTGEIDASAQESLSDVGLVYKVENSDTVVLNVTEMNIGVEFESGNISYGLGYELTNIQGLYSNRFPDDYVQTTLNNSSENLSLSGFYLRAGMAF